ncbi:MAG TPA: hypothetical protein VGK09_08365 [Rhodocyclaceae bacterium]|jgi:hypothetical protein
MADKSAVTGVDDFRSGLKAGFRNQRQALKDRLNALGVQMTVEIKAGCPKVTGALASTVRYILIDTNDGESLEIQVGDKTVFYAPHVEYGHGGHEAPAKPFVRPVVYRHEPQIPVAMEQTIIDSWGGS